jgi:hypothetical protein
VESATNDFIYGALFQGIRKDGALMAKLARKPPQNLDEFMSKLEEYVNQEETLRDQRKACPIPCRPKESIGS